MYLIPIHGGDDYVHFIQFIKKWDVTDNKIILLS